MTDTKQPTHIPETRPATYGELIDLCNRLGDQLAEKDLQIEQLQGRLDVLEQRRYYVLVKTGRTYQMTRIQTWDGEGQPPFPTDDDDDNQGQ